VEILIMISHHLNSSLKGVKAKFPRSSPILTELFMSLSSWNISRRITLHMKKLRRKGRLTH